MLQRGYLTEKVSYFMSCFVESLSGIEEFLMDASVLWHHVGKVREGPLSHVVIPLMVRFKGETGSRHHLQAVINKTDSKLNFMW